MLIDGSNQGLLSKEAIMRVLFRKPISIVRKAIIIFFA
jgi:hypothetical protein